MTATKGLTGQRILVVEDDSLISLTIEEALLELGCIVVGPVGRLDAALLMARSEALDAALLDVNIRGGLVYPVADVLIARGVPYALASGYGDWALPEALRDRPRLVQAVHGRGADGATDASVRREHGTAFRGVRTLLIVFHSVTGGTRQMAEAAAAAAGAEPGVRTRLLHAADAGPDDVLEANGYIFATPENLAAMAGAMKDFFDRTYYPVLDRANGRPYAAMVCAGSDGTNAARQIARIALGWRLRPVAESVIVCTRAQTPEAIATPKVIGPDQLRRCEELGGAMAAGLAAGIFLATRCQMPQKDYYGNLRRLDGKVEVGLRFVAA